MTDDSPGETGTRSAFVKAMKEEFEKEIMQQGLIGTDQVKVGKRQMTKKELNNRKHSRWHRELQRRGGTKQFWEIVSFTGRTPFQIL